MDSVNFQANRWRTFRHGKVLSLYFFCSAYLCLRQKVDRRRLPCQQRPEPLQSRIFFRYKFLVIIWQAQHVAFFFLLNDVIRRRVRSLLDSGQHGPHHREECVRSCCVRWLSRENVSGFVWFLNVWRTGYDQFNHRRYVSVVASIAGTWKQGLLRHPYSIKCEPPASES